MSEHELEKLLGGFATNTLTQEERTSLYRAALQDQRLFNALADEQALKDLLADPVVRRTLIQTLNQSAASRQGEQLSWLDWFRRPAGLALGGGLVAAAFAVVLGTKIYQEGLQEAAQSVATEEGTPAASPVPVAPPMAPTAPEIQEKAKATSEPPTEVPKKDEVTDKLATREHPAKRAMQAEPSVANLARETTQQQPEQGESQRQIEPAGTLSGKVVERPSASAGKEDLATNSPPPAAGSEPPLMDAPASAPLSGTVTPTLSARALFYAGEPDRSDRGSMAEDTEQKLKSLSESAAQANRPGKKLEQFSGVMKAGATAAQLKPLGLRYSFIVQTSDGQEQEVDAATAAASAESVRLSVEANQEAYVQIWKTVADSTPHLLFPARSSGQISIKLLAGQRQNISLPADRATVTLTARLSRSPFGPMARQEAPMLGLLPVNQLQESTMPTEQNASEEQATYVVNKNPSPTVQLVVEIRLDR